MTLLASANNPRLQCYCAPEQSEQCGKAAFLLGTSAGTTRSWFLARVGACCPMKPGKNSHGRGQEGCLGISAYTGASARLPDVEVSAVGIPLGCPKTPGLGAAPAAAALAALPFPSGCVCHSSLLTLSFTDRFCFPSRLPSQTDCLVCLPRASTSL